MARHYHSEMAHATTPSTKSDLEVANKRATMDIAIIKVGYYCNATNMQKKCADNMLKGVAGTIYKETSANLQELGMDKTATEKCLKKIHIQTLSSLHNIVKMRRWMEHGNEQ